MRNESPFLPGSSLRIERGPEGEFRYRNGEERGVRYDVWMSRTAITKSAPMSREEGSRYLLVPPLPRRIADLAQQWTKDAATPFEKARAIETHLRTEYRYDLASPSGGTSSPLDHFLFDSKRGHCEFYSTAMAVLLRYVGIPSRNVTGFIGGTYNRFSKNYTVRQGDAHSWVEAYVDGAGWMTFDPTPPSDAAPKSELRGALALLRDVLEASSQRWDRHVVGYDINQQLSLFDRFRGSFVGMGGLPPGITPQRLVLVAFALFLVGVAIWHRRRTKEKERAAKAGREGTRTRSAAEAASLYETLEAAMTSQGLPRPQGVPPLRHAEGPLVQAHALGAEIVALTETYLEVRFGGLTLEQEARREFERRVKNVRAYRRPKP